MPWFAVKVGWLVALLVTLVDLGQGQDPCNSTNHLTLVDRRRSPAYVLQQNENTICDLYNVDGVSWYKFGNEGARMTDDQVPAKGSCATYATLYLENGNPTTEGVKESKTVCQHDGNGVCGERYTIEAVKCPGDFYVYKLMPPSICDSAYCANFLCAPDESYINETGKCEGSRHPAMNKPILSGPLQQQGGEHMFYFECLIDGYTPGGTADDGSRFEVVFTVDGVVVKSDVLRHSTTLGVDDKNELKGKAGGVISCKARSYWEHYEHNASPYQSASATYFAGLQIVTDQGQGILIIREQDQPTKITMQSTVPITCKSHNLNCNLKLRVKPEVMNTNPNNCEVQIDPKDWKPNENLAYDDQTTSFTVTVPANVGGGTRTGVIKFWPASSHQSSPFWDRYTPPDVQVRAEFQNLKMCQFTRDPHFKTFDGVTHNVYVPGQFMISVSEASRVFEVQGRFKMSPWTTRSSTCAIAVREGNVALGIDMCKDNIAHLKKYSPDALPTGAKIKRDAAGSKYYIMMPSGAYVKANVFSNGYMDVYLYTIPEDKNKMKAFCGDNNDNTNNDVTQNPQKPNAPSIIESWRLDQGKSMFDSTFVKRQITYTKPAHCECSQTGTQISCALDLTQDANTQTIVQGGSGNGRMKSANDIGYENVFDESEPYDFDYSLNHTLVPLHWPTPSGISEAQARTACQAGLQSTPSRQMCETVVDNMDTSILDDCIFDIKAGDTLSVADDYQSVYEENCMGSLLTNVTIPDQNSTSSNSSEEEDPSLTKLRQIQSAICPNNCNNRGLCNNGTCDCNTGYGGVDCSLDLSNPPSIQSVQHGGLCDAGTKNCYSTQLYGSNIDGTNIICRREVQQLNGIQESGIQKSTDEQPGLMVTPGVVVCPLPMQMARRSATGGSPYIAQNISVSLSNDGRAYSTPVTVVTHDARSCVSCDMASCFIKSGSCAIGGRCYGYGETNPSATCMKCNKGNPASWTTEAGCGTSASGSNQDWLYAIIGVVGGLVCVTIVVSVFLVYKSKHKRTSVGSTEALQSRPTTGNSTSRKLSRVGIAMETVPSIPVTDTDDTGGNKQC